MSGLSTGRRSKFGYSPSEDMRAALARSSESTKSAPKGRSSIEAAIKAAYENQPSFQLSTSSARKASHHPKLSELQSNVNPFHSGGCGGGGDDDLDPSVFLGGIGLGSLWPRFQELGVMTMMDLQDPALCTDFQVRTRVRKSRKIIKSKVYESMNLTCGA